MNTFLGVRFELTRYLPDHWVPVIEKDVDGPSSLPLNLDGELPGTLGKFSGAAGSASGAMLAGSPTK